MAHKEVKNRIPQDVLLINPSAADGLQALQKDGILHDKKTALQLQKYIVAQIAKTKEFFIDQAVSADYGDHEKQMKEIEAQWIKKFCDPVEQIYYLYELSNGSREEVPAEVRSARHELFRRNGGKWPPPEATTYHTLVHVGKDIGSGLAWKFGFSKSSVIKPGDIDLQHMVFARSDRGSNRSRETPWKLA